MTIYMNEKDKERATLLLESLIEEGVKNLIDPRGNPSRSALFRYLVSEELERRGIAHE